MTVKTTSAFLVFQVAQGVMITRRKSLADIHLSGRHNLQCCIKILQIMGSASFSVGALEHYRHSVLVFFTFFAIILSSSLCLSRLLVGRLRLH